MKKTNIISKSIIVVLVVTFFVGCKKELDTTQNTANSATPVVNLSVSKAPRTPTGYAGTSTLGDTTKIGY